MLWIISPAANPHNPKIFGAEHFIILSTNTIKINLLYPWEGYFLYVVSLNNDRRITALNWVTSKRNSIDSNLHSMHFIIFVAEFCNYETLQWSDCKQCLFDAICRIHSLIFVGLSYPLSNIIKCNKNQRVDTINQHQIDTVYNQIIVRVS